MKLVPKIQAILCLCAAALLPNAQAASPALPPLNLVLQRVIQTSADENAEYHLFNQHYFYTREKTTAFFDAKGRLKSYEEKQSTNHPAPPPLFSAPHPVPYVPSGKETAANQPNIHGVALGKKEDLLKPEVVARFKFTLVGREMLNGRPALIVDFQPVSNNLPVFNLKDRFIDSISGRAWVDEADFVLEKVDLHLMKKFTVLGGVAGEVSKFNFSFLRERTPDGFWFTRSLDWHLEAREAAFERVVTHHEEILDVQQMR